MIFQPAIPMNSFPSIGFPEWIRLGRRFAIGFLQRPLRFDMQASLFAWLRSVMTRLGFPHGLILNILGRKVLLIANRELSDYILAAVPRQHSYIAGELKQSSMAVLAPAALTISQDEQWQQLRPYNERVLATNTPHPYQAAFLAQVQKAFAREVTDLEDIRQRMGTAMLGIVFGEDRGSQQLVADVRALAELVENPVKRIILSPFQRQRRDRVYAALKQLWQESQVVQLPSLLSMARAAHPPDVGEAVLLQQIPHWMFTFTGSGSLLLARTLTLMCSLPQVLLRVQQELTEHCPPDRLHVPEDIAKLAYLEACLQETGRLYPPVALTLHRAPQGDLFKQWQIPADIDILQVFPLMQHPRDRPLSSEDFQPERWLNTGDRERPYSNLFLQGPRTCPGKDLITFVCKGAIAHLLTRQELSPVINRFQQKSWPATFPDSDIRFRHSPRSAPP